MEDSREKFRKLDWIEKIHVLEASGFVQTSLLDKSGTARDKLLQDFQNGSVDSW